jgi:hypothetical protein
VRKVAGAAPICWNRGEARVVTRFICFGIGLSGHFIVRGWRHGFVREQLRRLDQHFCMMMAAHGAIGCLAGALPHTEKQNRFFTREIPLRKARRLPFALTSFRDSIKNACPTQPARRVDGDGASPGRPRAPGAAPGEVFVLNDVVGLLFKFPILDAAYQLVRIEFFRNVSSSIKTPLNWLRKIRLEIDSSSMAPSA